MHARRAAQWPVRQARPRQPTDQRVDHIETVDVEVHDQVVSPSPPSLIAPPPTEPTRGGCEEAGLDQPERVDEHLAVGQADPGHAAVDRRAGEQRWSQVGDERPGGRRAAVGRHRPAHGEGEPGGGSVAEPTLQVQGRALHREIPGLEPRAEETKHAVGLDAASVAAGQVSMHGERGDRAGQSHRSRYTPGERKARHAGAQPIERYRVRHDVGRDAERVRAIIQPHRAPHLAHGAVAVALAQRAAELRVLEGAGEGPHRGERPPQRGGGNEPSNGSQVHGRRSHGERLKGEPSPPPAGRRAEHVDGSPPSHAALRPTRHQRIAKGPIDVQRQGVEASFGRRVAAEMTVERQARQKGVGQHQIEVLGGEVGLPQAHDPGVGDR